MDVTKQWMSRHFALLWFQAEKARKAFDDQAPDPVAVISHCGAGFTKHADAEFPSKVQLMRKRNGKEAKESG